MSNKSSKSKREKLALLGAEIYSLKKTHGKDFDAVSHLSSVINTLAKGTRFEEEARLIINCVDPNYFDCENNCTKTILKVDWEFTNDIRRNATSNIGWNNFDAYCHNGCIFKPKENWPGLYKFIYFKTSDGKIIASNDNTLLDVILIDEEFEKLYVEKRGMIDIVEVSEDFKILRYKTWSSGITSEWINYNEK